VLLKNELLNQTQDNDVFEMIFFDPIYHDGRAIRVQIKLDKIIDNEWNNTNTNISVSYIWK
jgi:16S rRNA G966 N2-methylase RsmD